MVLGDNLKPPDAEWWLRRLERLVSLFEVKDVNKQGGFLIKFSVYSTFLDLTEVAMMENNKVVYEKAKKLLDGILPNGRPTVG